MLCSSVSTSRTCAASTKRWHIEPKKKVGPIATSSLFCSPKKLHDASKPDCSAAPAAHFPFLKTIDEFDFTLQSTLRQSLFGSYLGPDFVAEGRSLILYGK